MSAEDHRLINECLRGRNAAFGELIRRYQDRLYNTVLRLVGNNEDALDVIQETFLNAYKSLDNFKGDAEFFTWLYRIAYNTAISLRRKQKVALRIDSGRNGAPGVEPMDGSVSSRPGHALEKAEQEKAHLRCAEPPLPGASGSPDPGGHGKSEIRNDRGHFAGPDRHHPQPFAPGSDRA